MMRLKAANVWNLLPAVWGLCLVTGIGCVHSEVPHGRLSEIGSMESRTNAHKTVSVPSDEPSELSDTSKDEHERLGDTFARQGNWTLSLLHYERAIRMAPHQTRVRYKRGVLYLSHGLADEAETEFRTILRDDPRNAPALTGMGRALLHRGQLRQAGEWGQRALREDPGSWRVHALLGMIYDYQQQHVQAVAEYEAALRIKPNQPQLHNNLGRAWYLAGQYQQAAHHFEQALKVGQSDPHTYNNLGLALAMQRAYSRAWDAFRKAGSEPQAFYNLGVVYLEAGRARRAMACFKQAMDGSPSFYERAHEHYTLAQSILRKERPKQSPRHDGSDAECL